ncbi:MFS transporter [Cytobacillus purgationiresistens]|uniref:MFS family permease n=1 Tax=Cytobacillus purgationiresistens TaxID=863449 RepID=A0ABU0ABK6_9BACI|nr:MFS transporter [Cytobacillus purgationiresistens]MDQ0268636.1 MFS family permease [Cytobacillus purgationiresistens]
MNKTGKRTYYGWYIVISASLIVLLSMGLRMGIGPFVNPMILDLGVSRTEFSVIIAIGMIVYGLGMPLAGWLIKLYSTRFVLITGLLIFCASVLWTINANGMISFLLSFGILLSVGLSFLSNITLAPIVSKWFVKQRGKALFYLSTGGMAGMAVMTPVENTLIHYFGWHQTLLLLSGVFICVVLPSAIFIMRENVPEGADGVVTRGRVHNQDIQEKLTWKDAVRTRAYWQIVIGLFACGFGMNLMGTHAVPMLMDHHFEPMTASFGFGLIGIVAIFSSLFLGSIADRYPRKNILFWVYFVRGMGILGLVFVESPWQLFFVSVTGGLVWAGSIAMSSAILSDFYGVRLLGILNGWAFFGHQIGGAIGSFIGGWGYETFGTHVIAFGAAAFVSIIASIVSFRLPEKITFAKYIKDEVQSLSK